MPLVKATIAKFTQHSTTVSRPAIAQQGTASPQTRMWLLPPPRRSLTPARIRLPPRFLRRIPKLRRTRQAQLRPKPPRPPMPPRMRPPRRPPRLLRTRQTMPPTRTTPPIRHHRHPGRPAKLHRPAGGLAAQPGRGQYRARCPRGDPGPVGRDHRDRTVHPAGGGQCGGVCGPGRPDRH